MGYNLLPPQNTIATSSARRAGDNEDYWKLRPEWDLIPNNDGRDERYGELYENAYFRINKNIQKVGTMLALDTTLRLYVVRHA